MDRKSPLRVIVILLHEFVHSYEGAGAPDTGAAVHKDGLSVTCVTRVTRVTRLCHELAEDAPGLVHQVPHDLGVGGRRHVRPLDGLQLGHQAGLTSRLDNSDLSEKLSPKLIN